MKINRIMALALACVMLFVTGCNNKNNAPDKDGDNTPPNSENAASVMVGNIGMILCLVVMALVMAINLWPVR